MSEVENNMKDVCFPIPLNFSLAATTNIDSNEIVKRSVFQQTIQAAYQRDIPYNFTSNYDRREPYQLVSDEEIATIVSLFQAIQPKDALELALAQQFIITHIQAICSSISEIDDGEMKKFELTHKILETLMRYRAKFAQFVQVNYHHNEGQINNVKLVNERDQQSVIEIDSM